MSAYLERLATSVRAPSAGIVPLVRPVYLARPVAQETASTALEPLKDDTAAATTVSTADPRRDDGTRTAPSEGSSPPAPPPASFEPLLPEVPAPTAPGGEQRALDDQPTPAEVDTAAPVEATRPRDDARPAPALLTDSVRVARAPAEPRSVAPAARMPSTPHAAIADLPARIGPTSPRSRGPGPSGQRVPDEIQIHIGRVEVVAVPPAEPAPAPPRRERKSLELDGYLQNGG